MTLQMLLNQAVALHREGRLAEAEALYRQVLAQSPPNFQLQYRLALLQHQQQRPLEALESLRAALAVDPKSVEALVLQGMLIAAVGTPQDALASFDRALALKPDFPDALYHRALALIALGRLDDAVTDFDRMLAATPDAAGAWGNRGVVLQRLGRLAAAIESYDRALALLPNHAQTWLNRGTALQAQGRFPEALESFDRTLKLAPRHAKAWTGRGGALMGLQRLEEALESFDQALAIMPGDALVLQQRAVTEKAIETLKDIPDDENALSAWQARAAFQQIAQRFDDALAALDKALALAPDNSESLTRKGAVLCEMQRTAEGMAVYRHYAQVMLGQEPVTLETDPAHKRRHDSEQRDYLFSIGVNDLGFRLEPGARVPIAVNPTNAERIARRWRESDPQIVVIDNLLTEDALEGLRRFCWGSTIWRRPYKNGYLGAMPETGFACPLLAQIADELRDVFPTIIGTHGLRRTWGFKYDNSLSGIPMHADQAAVNVNFWIAPEDANTDPESGGLVVWDKKAPLDWDFARYNTDEVAIRAFLAEKGAKPIVVPHRANRAVVFDSDLFHETDTIRFKDGYQNRRINVTMLYGRRAFYGG